jgi:UDP-glucose 4-epimerase
MKNYFIAGGAGFIGSHLTQSLLTQKSIKKIVVYDNFSSGKKWHLEDVLNDSRLEIINADIKDIQALANAMSCSDVVYHFASNPDIAKAVTQPDIDFWEGTYLTNNILEAMRRSGVNRLLYASGSGVYGETGNIAVSENYEDMRPISTYGASKLACEALICSYVHMFGMKASAFRFANVVGPNQTHGVGYDFIRKLKSSNHSLEILGDGSQSKSYIYVSDVLSAMQHLEHNQKKSFDIFNVSTLDSMTVKEIADLVCKIMELKGVEYKFTGGHRGWKGDVPIIRINSSKIRSFGWKNQYNCNEAMERSLSSMYQDAFKNRFDW